MSPPSAVSDSDDPHVLNSCHSIVTGPSELEHAISEAPTLQYTGVMSGSPGSFMSHCNVAHATVWYHGSPLEMRRGRSAARAAQCHETPLAP